MRLAGVLPGYTDSVNDPAYIIAVNALCVPAKGPPFLLHRLDI